MTDEKVTTEVKCGQCGADIKLPDERVPCPSCGSLTRHINLTATTTLAIRDSLDGELRGPGSRKFITKFFVGADWFYAARKWIKKERLIDRRNDRYREVITDPQTGDVIHHCDEPLNQHRGHGSDRKTRKSDG